MVGADVGVIDIIEHLELAIGKPSQGQRAGATAEGEAGVQFVGGREIDLAVGEDDFEPAGVDDGAAWESPLCEVGVVVGQIEAAEGNDIGGGIEQFDPADMLAGAVGDAGNVIGLQLVDPQWREGNQGGQDAVAGAGCALGQGRKGRRGGVDGGGVYGGGQTECQGTPIGALEVPKA